ncbi:MAG: acyl-CoA/acyl-ACP dehydrogenase [Spirochaetes bacterium]|nr:acyl-CoA/acyl-ACP dehydrogenase [Spirochaetota bacterium]
MSRIRLSRKDKKMFLARDPKIADTMSSLVSHYQLPKATAMYKEIDHVVALARKFNDEVVKPAYKEIDLEVSKNNDYLCWDFIKKANEWGLYTLFLPKMFGGGGINMIAMYPFVEEIASVCVGLSNVIGVHYLGVATLSASWNVRLINKIFREVKKGERSGNPCLISLAITEPEAGTDVEETLLVDRARLGTFAKKVEGGYVVNGRKIFISNGHVSTWHMLICYSDKKNPSENTVMLAVKNGTRGFSFGHHEKKMGQKSCVASELIFEDCFIPDEYICIDSDDVPKNASKTRVEVIQQVIDYVVSSTRAGVAAFAVGAARGAYETALEYARTKKVGGSLLINHQWAQSMLSEMYKNVSMGRAGYMESAYANALHGMIKSLYKPYLFYVNRWLPRWYFTMISPLLGLKAVTRLFRNINFYWYPKESAQVSSGWASLVKFACTDLGIENSQMAVELMGIDGCRHDIGSEKFLRDAKLLQIYEGTNQLNRMNLFKELVGRDMPEVQIF